MVKNNLRWNRHVRHLQCNRGTVICTDPEFLFQNASGGNPKGRTETDKAGDSGAGLRALSLVHRADCLCHPQHVSGRGVRLLESLLDGVYRDVFCQSGGFLWPGLVVPGEIQKSDYAPGNGALRGVEYKGVDADPRHPRALARVAADYLSFGWSDLCRNRNADSLTWRGIIADGGSTVTATTRNDRYIKSKLPAVPCTWLAQL